MAALLKRVHLNHLQKSTGPQSERLLPREAAPKLSSTNKPLVQAGNVSLKSDGKKHEMNFRISNRSSEIACELRNVIPKFPAHLSISEYSSELECVKFAETDCKTHCSFSRLRRNIFHWKIILCKRIHFSR